MESAIDRLVENAIESARRDGDLDDLRGAKRPIEKSNLTTDPFAHVYLESGAMNPVATLKAKIAEAQAKLDKATDPETRHALQTKIDRRKSRQHAQLTAKADDPSFSVARPVALNRPEPRRRWGRLGAGNIPFRRNSAIRSNSRATRAPPMEVSTTAAGHSRLKSSITFSTRNRRPSSSASDMKSSDHLWLGPCGIAMGVLVPLRACVRPVCERSTLLAR